ncbi:hypothetical protein CCYA_CCYA14G3650 [Cyanidiococcus yangmingshanensis]|nr:hypothetical protein CCYA_CCYA14G3650 [Cyanidiococcus yangmingshanensis]
MLSLLRGKAYEERKLPFMASAVPNAAARALEKVSGTALDWVWRCWSTAQPWPQFFDMTQLTSPASAAELRERLAVNLPFYRGNYAIVGGGLLVLATLLRPVMLIAAVALFLLYSYLFFGQPEVTNPWWTARRKQAVLGVVSVVTVYWVDAFGTICSTLTVASLLAAAHGAFRKCADETDFEANLSNGR